jgi:uncharacterized protein YecE (DUF72 family)
MGRKKTQAIYIGTSGYSYQHWKGVFYPKDLPASKWLEFYSRHFNIVELNVTFYRQVPRKTFEGWYAKTPRDFMFVIKGSRFITHIKRLRACAGPLRTFFANASGLKEKLIGVLWQLPPSLKYDRQRLEEFIAAISRKYSFCLHSFEFRHPSWFNEQTFGTLKKYGLNLCLADPPVIKGRAAFTSSFIYLRFHGGTVLYGSQYSDEELKKWAGEAKKWLKARKLLMAFFNNDAQGFAVKNANTLKELLDKKS